MTIVLRDATAADVPAIAALHAANWRTAYADVLSADYRAGPIDADRLQVWGDRFAASDPSQEVVLAVTADGSLAGFTCLYHARDPRWGALVDNLHTSATARGTGFGKRLLREAARRAAMRDPATGIWLWVYEKNLAARGFYAALGGEFVETREQDWPAAAGEILLRCIWPSAIDLSRADAPVGKR